MIVITRMHFSRMHTVYWPGEGELSVRGDIWLGDVCPRVSACGCLPRRVPVQREGGPPVNRMTDACENITFLQLHCGRQLNQCYDLGMLLALDHWHMSA